MLRFLYRHFEETIAVAAMAALMVVLMVQVIWRYVLADPLTWSEELARYLFITVVFFGAAAAIRDRSHVGIPTFVQPLPAGIRLAVALVNNALILGFAGVLVWWGWRSAVRTYDVPTLALEIPTGLVHSVIPITAMLMALRTLAQMIEDVSAWRHGRLAETLHDDEARTVT